MTENGVIRVRSGRYMDRLNRAGLNFNLAGSVGPETDFFFRAFFFHVFFKTGFSYLFSYPQGGLTTLLILFNIH